ncbi:galactosylgalactosylxylosylprotein 3-beta-glucuronosyltransferase I [Anoplophora glabripennis]|uniref:galactosylgalactosylxylosylprotein 3-beta-glucuronosyltransferase I n=1 Tax=Anoplophora glabripennis TaxID=217634 RepID=UPI0008756A80|nr:galactosylgalactosylxylosylprotein 3-beta-glucuronosyltransferase I [Anoplophora glabripennis]
MDLPGKFDKSMRLKRYGVCFVILFILFVIWKLSMIETGVDRLQSIKEALELHKETLHLSQQQVLLLEHLENSNNNENINLPTIYAITPTYWRLVQKAELTRISQTLMLVPNVHWIVIEDSETKTDLVRNLILNSKLMVTHLNAKTPPFEQLKDKDPRWKRHRGVEQRNMALKWLRENLKVNRGKGIVFFMDDDNTYSIKLFEEIAKVKKVGVWPVGLVGGLNAETPIIDQKTGKVTGYKSGWKPDRPFAIDMAGFAINVDLILSKPEAQFSYKMEKGLQESEFLSYFTTKEELEPLADNCTKVYVWHTRTEKPSVNGVVPGLEV